MSLGDFKINGVLISIPQGLSVVTKVEKQTVTLLNGKRKSRVKRITRVATLHYSMLKQDSALVLLQQTLKKAVEEGTTEVTLTYFNEYGEMVEMVAQFDDITFQQTAEGILNGRWASISDLVFVEV